MTAFQEFQKGRDARSLFTQNLLQRTIGHVDKAFDIGFEPGVAHR